MRLVVGLVLAAMYWAAAVAIIVGVVALVAVTVFGQAFDSSVRVVFLGGMISGVMVGLEGRFRKELRSVHELVDEATERVPFVYTAGPVLYGVVIGAAVRYIG